MAPDLPQIFVIAAWFARSARSLHDNGSLTSKIEVAGLKDDPFSFMLGYAG